MKRFVDAAVKIVPLVKQAWPILVAIAAIVSDAFGATAGAATAAGVGLLAGGQIAGDRRRLDVVQAIAAPLKAADEHVDFPVFEFHPDRGSRRHRATALFVGGRKYDLENGPQLYIDAVYGGPAAGDVDYLDEDLDDTGEFDADHVRQSVRDAVQATADLNRAVASFDDDDADLDDETLDDELAPYRG